MVQGLRMWNLLSDGRDLYQTLAGSGNLRKFKLQFPYL